MTRPVMIVDFETRSALKLGRGGTNAFEYAKHPSTDVWCYAYTNGDRPLDRGTLHCTTVKWVNPHTQRGVDTMPPRLRSHVESGGIICAHNASFEYAVWNFIMVPRYGWCPLPIEQMDDTAARVARIGLPRSLERCAPLLNCRNQKDLGGKNTMKAMAKPRKIMGVMENDIRFYIGNRTKYTCIVNDLKQEGLRTLHDWAVYEWWDEPERKELLGAYCKQDVVTQLEVHQKTPPLPDAEREVWLATMRANIRGTALDTDFVKRAVRIINKRMEEYAAELSAVTNGQVSSHTQLPAMKTWMQEKGYDVSSLDKHTISALLDDKKMDADVKTALKIRQVAGKSSVAKFPSMKIHSGREGVAHDQIVYYGATATGRWSALGFQLQNLPARGPVTYKQAEWCIRLIKSAHNLQDAVDTIETVLDGSIIETLSMCLRGAIKARDGFDLYCADYSNIEGRKAAWLGGEQWKLDAFTAFDEGRGPDLYKVTAGGILGISPEDVDKTQRNVLGKVSELALGFQGGVGAYVSMGAVYGVNMDDYAKIIKESLAGYWEDAIENYESFGKAQGRDLSKRAWIASESVKLAWRARHPDIVQSWYDIEAAAFKAIQAPGTAHTVCNGKIGVLAKSIQGKLFLLLRLPSGRCIHYANVKIGLTKTGWGTRKDTILFDKVEGGRVMRSATYGGDLFQSCVQGTARDVMANGWLNTVRGGYYGLFSVHDEMASEIEHGKGDLDEYTSLLCDTPEWAAGCPVTASGYVSDRFRKD